MGVYGTLVGPIHAFPVGGEFIISNLVAELLIPGMEVELDPSDVMFGGVGVGDMLS